MIQVNEKDFTLLRGYHRCNPEEDMILICSIFSFLFTS